MEDDPYMMGDDLDMMGDSWFEAKVGTFRALFYRPAAFDPYTYRFNILQFPRKNTAEATLLSGFKEYS